MGVHLGGVEFCVGPKSWVVRTISTRLSPDERLTIAGSFSYTEPAATLNDENIIVLGDLEAA